MNTTWIKTEILAVGLNGFVRQRLGSAIPDWVKSDCRKKNSSHKLFWHYSSPPLSLILLFAGLCYQLELALLLTLSQLLFRQKSYSAQYKKSPIRYPSTSKSCSAGHVLPQLNPNRRPVINFPACSPIPSFSHRPVVL